MVKDERLLTYGYRFLDVFFTACAFFAAYYTKEHLLPAPMAGLDVRPNYNIILLLILLIWCPAFQYFNVEATYKKRQAFGRICVSLIKPVTASMLVLSLVFYVFKIEDVSRLLMAVFYVVNIGFLATGRWMVHNVIRLLRKKGYFEVNLLVVVIGSREAAREVIDSVLGMRDANFKVLGCLDVDPEDVGKEVSDGVRVIGTLDDLRAILVNQVVDEVVFAMPIDRIWNAERYFAVAEAAGVQIRIVPHWHLRKFLVCRPHFYSFAFEEFLGTPTFLLTAAPQKRGALLIKSALDYLVAYLLLILLSPLFLLIAGAIKLVSPGPVIFRQERCGLRGRRFTMYKFRTMVANAEQQRESLRNLNEADGPVFKISNDPRVIPYIGTFLRRTGMDELPQLVNVALGEMSLVGPRPPKPEEVMQYEVWERRRLSLKPGLTCIWQIQPRRNDIPFHKWMEMDLEYIDNWSLWLDCKILLRTPLAMVLGRGM